mmetsp:Transcript_12956/g.24778  ORF Transcript_12956/g.24778 Transcript_12956/m.24778 type:complete len:171 (-) Transcript_12956:2033-2545(-)
MPAADKLMKVLVNSRAVAVKPGATLLDAAREAGAYIPTLCYHHRFKPRAVCRLCLVEVKGEQNPVPACATPAKEGDEITTHSEALRKYRDTDVQMLLARHPNDCMKCEASGDCKLQTFVQAENLEEKWEKVDRGDPVYRPPLSHHTKQTAHSPPPSQPVSSSYIYFLKFY